MLLNCPDEALSRYLAGDGPRILAVVQSRIGSTRLPGKALLPFNGIPLLELVLERVKRAQKPDLVLLATSTKGENTPLEELAQRLSVPVFRGSEEDVLSRFVYAATLLHAKTIVRICADNPFIAPEEIDRAIGVHHSNSHLYTFNHIPKFENGYPDGFGAEVIETIALQEAMTSTHPRHREHVTAYIWDHPEKFHPATFQAPADIAFPEIKLDVDTAEDLENMRCLASACPGDLRDWTAKDIVRTWRAATRATFT